MFLSAIYAVSSFLPVVDGVIVIPLYGWSAILNLLALEQVLLLNLIDAWFVEPVLTTFQVLANTDSFLA